ncbi:hypothetical protein AAG594_05810 [Citromicrobium bathyomarinum]
MNKLGNRFTYFLVARSKVEEFNRQNSLSGYIFIVEKDGKPALEANRHFIEKHQIMLNSAKKAEKAENWEQSFDATQQSAQDQHYSELNLLLSDRSLLVYQFTLDRLGRVDIISARYNPEKGSNLSNGDVKKALIKGAFHSYVFLKDATHQHTHHKPDSDSILDVYLRYGFDELEIQKLPSAGAYHLKPKAGAQPNDVNWREEVLYALHRRAASLQMRETTKELGLARGIIKYASVFDKKFGLAKEKDRANWARYSAPQKDEYRWPDYDLDGGFDIAESRIEERKGREYEKEQNNKAFFSLFLAAVTLVLSYSSLLRLATPPDESTISLIDSSRVDPRLLKIAEFFLNNFSLVLSLFILIYIAAHFSTLWGRVREFPILGTTRKIALRMYLHSYRYKYGKFSYAVAALILVFLLIFGAYKFISAGFS